MRMVPEGDVARLQASGVFDGAWYLGRRECAVAPQPMAAELARGAYERTRGRQAAVLNACARGVAHVAA